MALLGQETAPHWFVKAGGSQQLWDLIRKGYESEDEQNLHNPDLCSECMHYSPKHYFNCPRNITPEDITQAFIVTHGRTAR